MRSIRIRATKPAAFLVSAALATTALGIWGIARWADAPDGARALASREMSGLAGLYPNYHQNYGDCACSSSTAEAISTPGNTFRSSCNCLSNPGSKCVACLDWPLPVTGFYFPGHNASIQPAGGVDVTCSTATQHRGICNEDGYCEFFSEDGACSGSIPPFVEEGIIGLRQPSIGHPEGTIGG